MGISEWPIQAPLVRSTRAPVERSTGAQIITTHLPWGKRAWVAAGAALEHYATRIKPAVEVLLEDLDSDHVDILVHPYMIGRTRETAQPFVFICCIDLVVLRRAEQKLRASNLLASNPPFKLGKSALPLGANAPLQGIAKLENKFKHPKAQLRQETVPTTWQKCLTREGSQNEAPDILVQRVVRSSSVYDQDTNQTTTRVGARLACRNAHDGTPVGAVATGGVILFDGNDHFQLTARHVWDNVNFSIHKPARCDDLDYCHFDGEDDEDDSELETGSYASLSGCTSTNSSPQYDTESSIASRDSTPTRMNGTETICSNNEAFRRIDEQHIAQSLAAEEYGMEDMETTFSVAIGFLHMRNTNISSRTLDYSLVHLFTNASLQSTNLNRITIGNNAIMIRTIDHIPATETEIVAATGSSGICAGALSPSPVLHIVGGRIMTLYQVLLHRDHVHLGDSGSAIINAATGAYYGHLVLGSPGGRLAYLLSGKDVLADIQTRQATHVSLSAPRRVAVSAMRGHSMPASAARRHAAEHHGGDTTVRPWLVRASTLKSAVQQTTRIKLEIRGDLLLMSQCWTSEEWVQLRRVVRFTGSRTDSTLGVEFAPVSAGQLGQDDLCISCIYWCERADCFITTTDVILLLERLFIAPARFTVEEKNRIRRNLEGFRPVTIVQEQATRELFDLVVGLTRPKPVFIRKAFKVFPWKLLPLMLGKMLDKYVRVSPPLEWQSPLGTSGGPPVSPALQPTRLVRDGDAASEPRYLENVLRLGSGHALAKRARPGLRSLPERICSNGDTGSAQNLGKCSRFVK